MERKRILLCLAHMSADGAEQRFVKEAFDSNWVVPLGPNVNGFEKDLEEFVNEAYPQPLPQGRGEQICSGQKPLLQEGAGEAEAAEARTCMHSVFSADPLYYGLLKQFAEENRNNPTEAERVLWEVLQNKGIGLKFRRQHIIEDFIVDFFCFEKMLTIELDGGYHKLPAQMKNDAERTARLKELGYTELRFTNEQVLGDIDGVVEEIRKRSKQQAEQTTAAPPQPSPKGEGDQTLAGQKPLLQEGSGEAVQEGFGEAVGRSRVVALSAGTAAVHLALLACGVGPGDEVLVQSFTFCASSHPITYLGATPVFVDSEPLTWNMDPDLLEHAIRDRIAVTGRKPKAIVPVALYGMPYDCDRILEIANRYDIPVVEDAAEGFGSRFRGRVLGTFGRFGVLSFNGNKMITTSGGGALICNAGEEDAQKIMWYATQAREAYPYYQHEAIGYNYRMSNICAGIGRGQMTIVNDHIAHHRHVQQLYEQLLAPIEGITVHSQPADGRFDSNYWLCTITIDPEVRIVGQENAYRQVITGAVGGAAGVIHAVDCPTTDCQPNDNVEALRVALDKANIEARPLWKPMHRQPVYRHAPAYTNGVSESLFHRGLCLPAGPYVTDDDVRYIAATIKAAIE